MDLGRVFSEIDPLPPEASFDFFQKGIVHTLTKIAEETSAIIYVVVLMKKKVKTILCELGKTGNAAIARLGAHHLFSNLMPDRFWPIQVFYWFNLVSFRQKNNYSTADSLV